MKQFACGDVVPGCDARWVGPDEDALLAEVARHAAEVHGLTELPSELVDEVRRHVVAVA